MTDALINTAGVAQLCGCSRPHATNVITKRPDFPAPAINLSQKARHWRRADVLAFLRRTAETNKRRKA